MKNLQVTEYQKNIYDLQDYIFKAKKFLEDNNIKFSFNKLMEFNEEIIKIENREDLKNKIKLIEINDEINNYVLDCSLDSLFEDIEIVEEFLDFVLI